MQRNVAFSGFARVVEEEPKVNTGALNFSASSSNPRKGQQNDSDNALLAQLLTDDLNNLQSLYLAESIQLELALKDSRGDNQLAVEVEKIELVLSPEQQSRIASLKAEIDYVQSQASKRVAEKLEKMREILESDNRLAAALQDALGAETRKETLDREFALVLGRVDAQGREDIDIVARGGVERVLGREKVGLIMVCSPTSRNDSRTRLTTYKLVTSREHLYIDQKHLKLRKEVATRLRKRQRRSQRILKL